MKIDNKTKEGKLQFFSDLYTESQEALSRNYSELEKCMKQYQGSNEIDGSDIYATTVRNITYEIIESQISSDIPYPKVTPSYYNSERSANAVSAERLCATLRDRLPFESLNDIDERYTYVYGGSVWYIEWDNSLRLGAEIGGVRIHCLSPMNFVPQPGIYDVEDMDFCFLKFTTTRAELVRRYGISYEEAELAYCEWGYGTDISDGDAVTVIICFYRQDNGEIGQFIFSGEVTLSDVPSYYRRKIEVCKRCGKKAEKCACSSPVFKLEDQLSESISIKEFEGRRSFGLDDSVSEISVPYYSPTSFPIVIRKNTSGEDSLYGQSDCLFLRNEQQAINKIESRILQKLLRSGVTPIMPEDATVAMNNAVFGQIIKMKPGESMNQYGTVDTTPDISSDIREADRLYDHAKRTLGISDALQGLDTANNESGYARQLKIAQANGRLESKRKMKHFAYARLDRLIFEHYLAFADEARSLYRKDAYGKVVESKFKRTDFIEYDEATGSYFYDDSYLFSVDLNGGAEYQKELIWEKNLENLNSGSFGDKSDPRTLLRYWQAQERAHYPHARENVEYFCAELTQDYKEASSDAQIK